MNCKLCNKELNNKTQKIFCSKSCSISFSNTKRIVTEVQKNKTKQTLMGKYNKKYCVVCNVELLKNRKKKTCSEECLHNLRKTFKPPKTPGGYRKGSGRGKNGWYDNIHFDSTYELAYYIYCKQNGLNIERCKESYPYTNSEGKKCFYFPDFRVEGKIIEIKGFINKDVNLKIKAVNEPVELLLPNDLKNIFNFVEKHIKLKIKNLYKLYGTPDGARTRKSSP